MRGRTNGGMQGIVPRKIYQSLYPRLRSSEHLHLRDSGLTEGHEWRQGRQSERLRLVPQTLGTEREYAGGTEWQRCSLDAPACSYGAYIDRGICEKTRSYFRLSYHSFRTIGFLHFFTGVRGFHASDGAAEATKNVEQSTAKKTNVQCRYITSCEEKGGKGEKDGSSFPIAFQSLLL